MLRHVAVFRWHDGTTEAQTKAVGDELARLPALIPALRAYRFGADAGLTDGNWDYAVVADFDDADGWRSYRDDAEHQRITAERIRPLIAERVAVQYLT